MDEAEPTGLEGLARRLVEAGELSALDAGHAVASARQAGVPLWQWLADGGRVPALALACAASREFGLPHVDLPAWETEAALLAGLNAEWLLQVQAWPLARRGQRLQVAIGHPRSLVRLQDLRFHTGLVVEPVLADPEAIGQALERWQARQGALVPAPGVVEPAPDMPGTAPEAAAPVVRFIDSVLAEAMRRGASDVHFEPYEDHCRVRLRIDGLLRQVARAPLALARPIAARLKVMAQLDIAERQRPQDGRIQLPRPGRAALDGRLSTLPTLFGEKLVLRLLDGQAGRLGLDALGYSACQRRQVLAAIGRPCGLVLVTGPTGSGKTVSLYAALERLNDEARNIATVEDPVEIRLAGVNQVQRNPRRGLDFATALRALLRQDPDVIMVGEIRDLETAEIAIKAAQTGHMVLSTLHTNDAPQTLVRLLNMGIAPYNLTGSVSLVTAQRLLRRLCPHCRRPLQLPPAALRAAGFSEADLQAGPALYQAAGCAECTDGYRGRLGVHQVMPMGEAVAAAVLAGGEGGAIAAAARAAGVQDLRRAALDKALAGLTSLAEVDRVTSG